MAGPAALNITGLEKSYLSRPGRKIEILRGLDLQVDRGEVYGLLGKNGAGKSTTFRLLMGLNRPDAGEINILGGHPGEKRVNLHLGYCPENPQFHPNLSVLELLKFHSSLVRERILTPATRIKWLIDLMDLGEYRKRQVRTLSRGTVQRLALAMAILARPEFLVLDEPLTALDPILRCRIGELLSELKQSGTGMIISSHILSELEDLSDRLGILSAGVIQREMQLNESPDHKSRMMEIAIPFEKAKEVLADNPDLIGQRDGLSQRFQEIEFRRAQKLVQEWSAAGIPILEINHEKTHLQREILANLDDDEIAPGCEAPPKEEVRT
jgi:ABC-2 type transport system ATP-binding protein